MAEAAKAPRVVFATTLGDITIELFPKEAPVSTANFLQYVDDGFYAGTIFHRVIPGFVLQCGGLTPDLARKPTRAPIKNEAENGLKNARGFLSMARTSDVDSATSQFFVNLVDNKFLDHGTRDFGYAVFGKVVAGLDVVDKIAAVKTNTQKGYQDVPVKPVAVTSARREVTTS